MYVVIDTRKNEKRVNRDRNVLTLRGYLSYDGCRGSLGTITCGGGSSSGSGGHAATTLIPPSSSVLTWRTTTVGNDRRMSIHGSELIVSNNGSSGYSSGTCM